MFQALYIEGLHLYICIYTELQSDGRHSPVSVSVLLPGESSGSLARHCRRETQPEGWLSAAGDQVSIGSPLKKRTESRDQEVPTLKDSVLKIGQAVLNAGEVPVVMVHVHRQILECRKARRCRASGSPGRAAAVKVAVATFPRSPCLVFLETVPSPALHLHPIQSACSRSCEARAWT